MPKICLVLPKYAIKLEDPCCYPLGFMYVSSFLKSVGNSVKVLNYNLFEYDYEKEISTSDAVYFTGSEAFLEENINKSNIARKIGKETWIGGLLATFNPEKCKEYFDYIFYGELDASRNLNFVPWPDYEAFGIEEYHERHALRYMGILGSRGCPYSCTFCSHIGRYRERAISFIEDEIDYYIKKYKIEMLVFNDNTLNVRKSRFINICDMLKSKKIKWSAAIRADRFDEEMATSAKDAGCQYFVVGIESFRQDRLDKMHKQLKVENLKSTLGLLHKYKIDYHGNILLGLENETVKDIQEEISEIPSGYNVFPVLLQRFPGIQAKSSLKTDERNWLNNIFTEYAESHSMGYYPEC